MISCLKIKQIKYHFGEKGKSGAPPGVRKSVSLSPGQDLPWFEVNSSSTKENMNTHKITMKSIIFYCYAQFWKRYGTGVTWQAK
jgi:hypothetical protein